MRGNGEDKKEKAALSSEVDANEMTELRDCQEEEKETERKREIDDSDRWKEKDHAMVVEGG